MTQMLWELKALERALHAGDGMLAERYLEKALDLVRCVYCHKELTPEKPYHLYFKGYRHDECAEKYHGRGDYLHQHPEST